MKDIAKFICFGGLFFIPFIVLYVENDLFFPYITGKNFSFRIITEVVFAAWVILALYDAQYRPRFSWIGATFVAFLTVMFFANFFGENRLASFWSNFERMDGYVTLVHMFLFFIVLGSVMKTEKLWLRYFHTTIAAALLLSVYAFGQKAGFIEHRYGGFRVDATLGNATYMAVYMLFHVAIATYLALRAKGIQMWTYIGLIALFSFLLIQTATRGTTLALVAFFIVMGVSLVISARNNETVRKGGIVALVTTLLLIGGFIAVKDTEYVQNSPTLTRVANINLKEGTNRFNIWGMAFEGVKERPLLGWGQSNYNYVFNTYYRPELHGAEAWFDRVHNIVMDWLVAGGFMGAIAYFSIVLSAVYYVFVRPLFRGDETFTPVERSVLLGILAGYMVHNLFVFDNIVSYIFYAVILAYIHIRVGKVVPSIDAWKINSRVIEQVATPVVGVILLATVYYVNVPGIQAAGDIIDGFKATNAEEVLGSFERALSRGSFGTQEIREQMMQRLQPLIGSAEVSPEFKEKATRRVEEELLKQLEEKPGDARAHVFISAYYRSMGNIGEAERQLEIARTLSPKKQLIIYEQGIVQIQKGDYPKAVEYFKQAFDLGPQFMESRVLYATAAVYAGQLGLIDELISTEEEKIAFAQNDSAIQAVYQAKMYPLLLSMFELRITQSPNDPQMRTNLAFVLNEMNRIDEAIEVLEKAGQDIPSFKVQADAFIQSLRATTTVTTN